MMTDCQHPRTSPDALARATSHLPGWLAAEVAAWVQEHEDRGWEHTSVTVAVRLALEEIAAGRWPERPPLH